MTLSNRELREMRAAVEGLFPDTANLLTVTSTPNGQGGFTEAWGTATRNVSCRIDQMVGRELMTDGALRPFVSLEMALPYDTVVTEAYRVEHGGNTYAVINANLDQSWQIERVVMLEKV
jgi:SPP1 family predicted phage head-tail adaptor